MHANIFRGVGVALVTPFNDDFSIDYVSLEKIINHVINNNVDYLVTLGTTGETPTLSIAEKIAVLEFTKRINNNRIPLVCGIGGFNTQEVIDAFATYPLDGVDAILSVSPYYNKPTQEGIYQHFVALNAATKLPIIAYNVPGRTGVNMSATTIVRIANDCENIIAIKDACSNVAQNMEVIKNAPSGFVVLSGDDDLVLPQIACGVQGVISVAANCFTKDFCQMTHLALAGNIDEARVMHYKLLDGINLLFADGNPCGVKYVMHKMGLCKNIMRLPIVPVSKGVADKIDAWMAENAV
jgi:4-hydroxy-tetrahydrodipicolinate synthase